MGKTQKPFLAARIPIGLEKALERHTISTGESKTAAIINALKKYVGWSGNDEQLEPSATDRLTLLEIKVAELEKRVTAQNAIKNDNKLDNNPGLANKQSKTTTVIEKDNKSDNKHQKAIQLDAQIQLETQNVISTDNNLELAEQKLLTHKEFSELTGISINTLRSKRNYKNSDVTWEGITYQLTKLDIGWRWSPITGDNNVIIQPAESSKLS